jgi:Flp pilus assembly protein TadG
VPGQALAEFALIFPLLLLLVGAALDFSRVYSAWLNLEAATRDAAEHAATYASDSAGALTDAQGTVCAEFGLGPSCTDPSVAIPLYTQNPGTSSGGSTTNPAVTVTVTAQTSFRTLFAYPIFTQNGTWTLQSVRTFTILQGR